MTSSRQAAVIIGANGGIGGALADALDDEGAFATVHRLARSAHGDAHIDLQDEASIEAAAKRIEALEMPVTLIICASGLLHDGGKQPEKALRDLDADWLMQNYAVNAIGPALVAKHFLPLMPRKERCVFAAISARVGSISDNRLGGWHGYRASKAALNMLIRNIAIEWSRRNERSIAVALHPGTVDTALSTPFQGNVQPGKLFSPERAAMQLLDVLDELRPVDTGKLFAWDGQEITP
ncbi:SDR family NAD(P)-dependent oxidoreductase [Alterisphingorhabdus coralli]|uniref:SDR family NAD(P)-dependent oxidoreductase n=1 Tax=Alterisphingorhabdus coralli TaxID=3071408 RepID=A0AA97I055_9SPHN|nr:SDR family NAD(P)-dependent oxidoreductase [Parasphingorhabdus sp. SCSIO 66989]WOE74073.1 SDR family NAD(P)-dependent oxidoreductase [Parasphingorhabdus sp. SCSIO 66989]